MWQNYNFREDDKLLLWGVILENSHPVTEPWKPGLWCKKNACFCTIVRRLKVQRGDTQETKSSLKGIIISDFAVMRLFHEKQHSQITNQYTSS